MGNLLWIDARATGFSYSLMDDPSDAGARNAEFDTHNFNTYIRWRRLHTSDPALFGRPPDLQDNEVVIVGESYGGTRATILMNLLLFHDEYDTAAPCTSRIPRSSRRSATTSRWPSPTRTTIRPRWSRNSSGTGC